MNSKNISWNIRNLFSYVPQDVQVFNDDLRFNLSLWDNFKDKEPITILKEVWLFYLSNRAKKWKTILDIMIWSNWLKLSW